MDTLDLDALAREHAATAAGASSGRSAVTVFGGRDNTLRQTLIAVCGGVSLDEHESPGEATLQVLSGRVRMVGASGDAAEAGAGQLVVVPAERHHVEALEDSVVLLTVGKH
ncbi:MAG: LuxR family transcriptional regulator [Actinomycetota bacterium]